MAIEINGDRIIFSSPKKSLMTISCKLVSAFLCPKCNGILKVYFETEKPIPWVKYEGVPVEHSVFDAISVIGGQALIDKKHGSYEADCDLEIYWKLNPEHSLLDWLEKNFPEHAFESLKNTTTLIRRRQVPGFFLKSDLFNEKDLLLCYDKKEFEGEWDSQKESYEKWEKRNRKKLKERIDLLGCVRKKN